ncbi:hypothetical protein S245_036186, partial [Arachis hypogaea]
HHARGACVSARGGKQGAFNAVNRGNRSDVKFVQDEDSQQVTIFLESRLIL